MHHLYTFDKRISFALNVLQALTPIRAPIVISDIVDGKCFVHEGHGLPIGRPYMLDDNVLIHVDSSISFVSSRPLAVGPQYQIATPRWNVISSSTARVELQSPTNASRHLVATSSGIWSSGTINGVAIGDSTPEENYDLAILVAGEDILVIRYNGSTDVFRDTLHYFAGEYSDPGVYLKVTEHVYAISEDRRGISFSYPFAYFHAALIALEPFPYEAVASTNTNFVETTYSTRYNTYNYQGAGRIYGTVFQQGEPSPLTEVWLYVSSNGQKIRSTVSNEAGNYEFSMLDFNTKYFIVASNGAEVSINMREAIP